MTISNEGIVPWGDFNSAPTNTAVLSAVLVCMWCYIFVYLLEMVHINFSVQEQKSLISYLDRREIELSQNHCFTASVTTNTLIEYSVALSTLIYFNRTVFP